MSRETVQTTPDRKLLGEILVKRHFVTETQLRKALDAQRQDDKYLGEILIELGFVEDRDIVVALVIQCNLPYIAIDKYEIEQNVLNLLTGADARKYFAVPLDRVGQILSVVMADPLNTKVKDELEGLTGCHIAAFISTKEEILRAIDRWYR